MKYADLYTSTPATMVQRGQKPVTANVSLFWSNHDPAEVTVTVTLLDQQEPWSVGRSLFVAAAADWARGTWMGGGDFAVCYTGGKALLSLRPDPGAILICPGPFVEEFIAHSQRIVPCGSAEERITLQRVSEAIERMIR